MAWSTPAPRPKGESARLGRLGRRRVVGQGPLLRVRRQLAADEVETLVQSETWQLTDAHKRCCGGVFSVLEHSLDRDALRLDCPSEPLWFPRQACVVDTWTNADDLSGDLQRVSLDGSGDWY